MTGRLVPPRTSSTSRGSVGEPVRVPEAISTSASNHSASVACSAMLRSAVMAWAPNLTWTSAKMATLYSRGALAPGERWHQESITGSLFTGWIEERGGAVVPYIQGRAFVTSRATLFFDPHDPFRFGFPES